VAVEDGMPAKKQIKRFTVSLPLPAAKLLEKIATKNARSVSAEVGLMISEKLRTQSKI
jgi:hypothetical protein